MAINKNPDGHKGFQFKPHTIKTSHAGGWDRNDYHSHQKAHPDKLRETSEKRQMKPVPRSQDRLDKPKPSTKVIDLSTGKKTELDKQLEQANTKDLKKRGIK